MPGSAMTEAFLASFIRRRAPALSPTPGGRDIEAERAHAAAKVTRPFRPAARARADGFARETEP